MSAFQVSDKHITALIAAFNGACVHGQTKIDERTAPLFGQMLMLTNYHSVVATYGGRHEFDMPEFRLDTREFNTHRVHIEQLKLLQCYMHNSGTAPGWKDTPAYDWACQLQSRIISRMEGWEAAAYSI